MDESYIVWANFGLTRAGFGPVQACQLHRAQNPWGASNFFYTQFICIELKPQLQSPFCLVLLFAVASSESSELTASFVVKLSGSH